MLEAAPFLPGLLKPVRIPEKGENIMSAKRRLWLITVTSLLFLCFAPSIFATTTTLTLTSPGSSVLGTNVLDGVYVGPYTATINGASVPIICDDYDHETYLAETWTAAVNTFSNLSATKWAQSYPGTYTTLYKEAGWLIQQMYSPSNSSQVGEIQYAIWGVFDPSAISDLTSYNSTDGSIAQNWLTQAQNADLSRVDTASFTIYTPLASPAPTCSGSPCPTSPPQEFMTYSASEPSFLAILGVDFLIFGFAFAILRRRGVLMLHRQSGC